MAYKRPRLCHISDDWVPTEAERVVLAIDELLKTFAKAGEERQNEMLKWTFLAVYSLRHKPTLAVVRQLEKEMEALSAKSHQAKLKRRGKPKAAKGVPKVSPNPPLSNLEPEDKVLDGELFSWPEEKAGDVAEPSVACHDCGKRGEGSREFLKAMGWKLKAPVRCLACDMD